MPVLDQIIFTQERVGLDERLFTIYKFRTMDNDGEHERVELISLLGRDIFGKAIDDPRNTPLGRIMRKYWIDELPQLWNIRIGDMDWIGPRPLMPDDYYALPQYLRELRKRVKPGFVPCTYADYFDLRTQEDTWTSEMRYLEQKLRNPKQTDLQYFLRALNSIRKGVRGS